MYEIQAISSLTVPGNAFVNRSLYDRTVKVRLCDIQRPVSLGPPNANMQYCSIQHSRYNRNIYLLTRWCRVLLQKLTGLQLVKKFPAFHGTRRFITALKSVRHLSILGQPNPVHIPTSHLLEIHPSIIHPSTPRSSQWSLSFRFPH